jgi:hypothetical protein
MSESLTRNGKRIVRDNYSFAPQLLDFNLNFSGSYGQIEFRYEDKTAVLELIDLIRTAVATDPVPEVPVVDPPGA